MKNKYLTDRELTTIHDSVRVLRPKHFESVVKAITDIMEQLRACTDYEESQSPILELVRDAYIDGVVVGVSKTLLVDDSIS